jgi:hypothetical protein
MVIDVGSTFDFEHPTTRLERKDVPVAVEAVLAVFLDTNV